MTLPVAGTPLRLYQGQPGTTDTLLYTVPSSVGRRVLVKEIVVANTTASAATITVGLTGITAADALLWAVSVNGNETMVVDLSQVLEPGEVLRALQGTASALTVTISGEAA